MKLGITILALMFSAVTLAGESIPMYRIISDTVEKGVESGKTRVYGKVTFNDRPMAYVKISTIDHNQGGITDSLGRYSCLIDSKTTQLYAFQIGYREVVTQEYDFVSKHGVNIDFYLQERYDLMIQEKPVIYAYSPKEIEAKIQNDQVFHWLLDPLGEKVYPRVK